MARWEEPPGAPLSDANHAPLICAPSGELDWLQVRATGDGTIAITEVGLGVTALPPDGAIYVEGCQNILVAIHAVTLGTATNLVIYPKFAFDRAGTFLRSAFHLYESLGNLPVHTYSTSAAVRLTANQPQIVNLFNPGCRWMKMFAVAGTNAATSADIRVARGYVMPCVPFFSDATVV